jgi:predicted Na+-dependent transporter
MVHMQAVKAWKALLYGMVSILFITAFSGFVTMQLPFEPQEFAIGLSIFACVPTLRVLVALLELECKNVHVHAHVAHLW